MKSGRIFFLLIPLLLLAACGGDEPAPTSNDTAETNEASTESIPTPEITEDESGAQIYRYAFNDMTLHGFVNPPEGAGNGTYIIETENSLVLIDSQFAEESSRAFRAYVDSLDKPIDRIYLPHEHPDHINGLGNAFADVDSYGSPEVVELAAEAGITISNVVEAGTTVEIDGIRYEFEIFKDVESEEALVIKLPAYGVMGIGDFIYNDYHMVMNPNIPNWLEQMEQLKAQSEYQLLLSGHGVPTGTAVYAEVTDYLETALSFYNEIDDPDEFQAAMIEAYPDHKAPFFLGLSAQRLYPK